MAKGTHVPLRMCVVCRDQFSRDKLFRLVKVKEQTQILLDPEKRLCGKGVYLCRRAECLERLRKERRLRRLILERLQPGALEWMLGELGDP